MKEKMLKVNSYYEGLIQNLYAGVNGCFPAFMQFFYQYNQAVVFNPDMAECFESLYKVELENCNILCEIILKMGGDNKYYSSSRKYLSGFNVDYIKNFQKIFLADIEILEISILDVKSLIGKIENIEIRKSLEIVLKNKKMMLKKLKEKYFKNNLIS